MGRYTVAVVTCYEKMAAWLVQLVGRQTTEREVAGSNPGRTTNQGLKITGKIMLAVHQQPCLSSDDRVVIGR